MKRLAAAVLTVLCSVAFAPAYVPLPAASASDSGGADSSLYPVELTSAQTLALYGQSFDGLYYNGVGVVPVTFNFWKSSRSIVQSIDNTFSASYPFISGVSVNNPTAIDVFGVSSSFDCTISSSNVSDLVPRWFANQNVSKMEIAPCEFLIYRCQMDATRVSENDFDFEFNFDFSLDLENVSRFRSMIMYSTSRLENYNTSSNLSNSGYMAKYQLFSNAVQPIYTTSSWVAHGSGYDIFNTCPFPLTNAAPVDATNLNNSVEWFNTALFPCPNMNICAIDTDYFEFPTTLTSTNLILRRCNEVVVKSDHSYTSSDGSYSYEEPCVYIAIMCPVIWGDFVFPSPEPPAIGEQLEGIGTGINDINVNLSATNHKLDLILQKLDMIYQEMVDDNGGADLVPPDTIGLSPSAKQRVLNGLSGLDDTMSNVHSEDFNSSAVQGIGSFWGRVKGVLPSGLWSVYMLCLVGGIVSWIIYGKRGG